MNGIVSAVQGRFPKDAGELRYTSGGRAFLGFSLAVNDDKRGENEPTEWVRVTVWGEDAERLDGALAEGQGGLRRGAAPVEVLDHERGHRPPEPGDQRLDGAAPRRGRAIGAAPATTGRPAFPAARHARANGGWGRRERRGSSSGSMTTSRGGRDDARPTAA